MTKEEKEKKLKSIETLINVLNLKLDLMDKENVIGYFLLNLRINDLNNIRKYIIFQK